MTGEPEVGGAIGARVGCRGLLVNEVAMVGGAPAAAELEPGRALVPLWVKLGLVFGLLMAIAQAAFSWFDLQDDLDRERERRRRDLLGLARTMAAAIEGERLDVLRRSEDRQRPEWQELRTWLHGAISDNDVLYAVVLRADARGRWSYVVVGDEAGPLPPGFPVFDVAPGLLEARAGEPAYTADWRDEWGRYDSAFAPIRDRAGAVVAVLELDVDADARDLLVEVQTSRLLRQIALGVVLSMLVAAGFARYLNRHLRRLTQSALALAKGDLSQRAGIRTRDEIGLLGRAFDQMVRGLQ
jgi:HAMP domain-containing protein